MQGKKGKRVDEREIMSEIFNPPSGKKIKKKAANEEAVLGPRPPPPRGELVKDWRSGR